MDPHELNLPLRNQFQPTEPTLIDVIPEFAIDYPPAPRARRIWLPVLLFFATCISTFVAGLCWVDHVEEGWWPAFADALMYSGAVMTILLCHEMGHFLQALRYGVHASLPYFLPMPFSPIGTFGAVIGMEPRRGDRKAVFDIGISGPLAGLLPTIVFLCVGLFLSHVTVLSAEEQADRIVFGKPLLMQYAIHWLATPTPPGSTLLLHPLAFAGWVGLLITSINLFPIGQLDGGHILYGMFRERAHVASTIVLVLAISATIRLKLWNWGLMLGLITIMGPNHPPTADDSVPLGTGRYVLGILTLAFLVLGFTPVPISL